MKLAFRMPALLFVTMLLCSCATSSQPTIAKRYVWPIPPAEPKIEFIGAYASKLDLKTSTVMDKIIGEDDVVWLNNPTTAVGDGVSKVYVPDKEQVSIFVFDFAAKDVYRLGGEALLGVLPRVNALAIDGQGKLYITDSTNRRIVIFDPVTNISTKSLDLSKYVKSIGRIAIDTTRGRIVIPDIADHKLVVTDLDGNHLLTIGKKGAGDAEFNAPQAVAIDRQGVIVVADTFNARIQRLNPDGTFINKFGKRGDSGGDLSLPKGVAVDSDGHIYVTDAKEHRVTIYSDKGEYLLSFGGPHAQKPGMPIIAGGFMIPLGIYIDKNDRIYVADQQNGRFQVFQYLNARYLAERPFRPEELPSKSDLVK